MPNANRKSTKSAPQRARPSGAEKSDADIAVEFFEKVRAAATRESEEKGVAQAAAESAERKASAASIAAFEPERRDAILEAAHKLQILADALVTHSDHAEDFEDIETVAAIVLSVAKRQSDLAYLIVAAFESPENRVLGKSTAELASEAANG
jgi:hypothetical protein